MNGIKEVLKALIDRNIIVEHSKIVSKDVLLNKNRARIYSLIEKHPGINLLKIVKEINLSLSVVSWHLSILERFNFIKKEKEGGNTLYYRLNFSYNDARLLNLLTKKKCQKIIRLLLKISEPISVNNISNELKMHRKTINSYLNKLIDFKLITKEKSTHFFSYSLDRNRFSSIIENFKELEDVKPWLYLLVQE